MFSQICARISPVRSLDGRVRFLMACGLSLTTACLTDCLSLCLALSASLLLLLSARPVFRILCRRFLSLNLFILFLWLFLPWSVHGTAICSIGPFSVTAEGILLAVQISLKANTIFFFFLSLMTTMSLSELGHAMQLVHVPEKLVFLFIFTERSVHFLYTEWCALKTAARLRAFEPRCSMHSYRTIASLLGILILRSVDHAHTAYEALLLRGFAGRFVSPATFSLRRRDYVVSCLTVLFILLLILFQFQFLPDPLNLPEF